ncbi:PcfJ domain-containing protein [Gimesia aquarii]|nr:PcfJ domain-containing protein [Gimesia aquarii]
MPTARMMLLPERCAYIVDLSVTLISCTDTMASQQQKHHAACRLDDFIARYACSLRGVRNHFWQLIHAIRAKTCILSPRVGAPYVAKPTDTERIIKACERIARSRRKWERLPETWSVPEASPFVQMRSLVQHLFDQYPVPNFMAPVWWSEHYKDWGMQLYLHLATGQSVRQFSSLYSFRMTKRIAALFMQAPDDLHPIETLRWSQVRALGGDDRLARILIRKTCLWTPREDEEFWESVIRFLIQNAPIATEEIVEIVRFIHEQRFKPAEKTWGPGAGDGPVQPDFSLRGRSLMSLRRHMVHWRSELIEKGMMPPPHVNPLDFPWQRSNIGSFQCEEEGTVWTIEELLTPRQLHNEGRIMDHCVADYISDCARRKTTIWSLGIQKGKRRRRKLTIEVLPKSKLISQASGKHNCEASDSVQDKLNRWAAQEGLKFSETA